MMQIELLPTKETIQARAVLFDLDGTLVESTGSIGQILKDWAIENALDAQAVMDYSHGKRSIDIVQHFIGESDVKAQYDFLTSKFVAASDQTIAIQGAAEFIAQLNKLEVPWAVVSSSERILIEARMLAAGLPKAKSVISAEDVEHGKPSPEGYLKGAQLLNVDINDCVVFEDAPSGIQAARQAKAQLITIGGLAKSQCSLNICDYSQLIIK